MREYIVVKKNRKIPVIFTCNMCGKTMDAFQHEYEEFMTDTIHNFKIEYGYGSNRDGEIVTFDICESCLEKIYEQFEIKPNIEEIF